MRSPLVCLAAAAVLLTSACSESDQPSGATGSDPPVPAATSGPSPTTSSLPASTAPTARDSCSPGTAEALQTWADAGFSGSVAMTSAGRIDCALAFGEADRDVGRANTPDTVFSIGSVTKAVTAATIATLIADGTIGLDDRAGDLVPGLTGPAAGVTIEQLLLHTSGLAGSHGADHEPLDRDTAVAAISRLELAFEPGADYAYSNAGYTLLALVIEAVTPDGYRRHTMASTLTLPDGSIAGGFWDGDPAASGPRAIGYLDNGTPGVLGDVAGPHWATEGNGAVAMTMPQLAAWTTALFAGDLLPRSARDLIATPSVDHGDGTFEVPGFVWFAPERLGAAAFAAAGGGGDVGHNVAVAWLPDAQRAVAIASNTADVRAEDLLGRIAPALIAGELLPTPADEFVAADPGAMAAATGTYRLPGGDTIDVAAAAGGFGLDLAANGTAAIAALFPVGPELAAEVDAHEAGVIELLEGHAQVARDEQADLNAAFGQLSGWTILGTIVAEGELRTYVALEAGGQQVLVWYAVTDIGDIAAVEAPADLPVLHVRPVGDGRYRPVDPLGDGPDVTCKFGTSGLSISGSAGTITAARET